MASIVIVACLGACAAVSAAATDVKWGNHGLEGRWGTREMSEIKPLLGQRD